MIARPVGSKSGEVQQVREEHLQVWALSTDPVPGKDCQGHAEGAKAMGRQPGYQVQQLGLHAVAV